MLGPFLNAFHVTESILCHVLYKNSSRQIFVEMTDDLNLTD